MTNNSRISLRISANLLLVAFMLVMTVVSCIAQEKSGKAITYLGFETSFGSRAFTSTSNIEPIDHLRAVEEGGSLGVVFGNDYLRTKLRVAGFYYASANSTRTIDLFETEMVTNMYPLQYLRTHRQKTDVYFTGGLSFDRVEFFGHYLDQDASMNYSTLDEPYVGKINQVSGVIGLGAEYHVPTQKRDFVHLFAEGRIGVPIQATTSKVLSNTQIREYTSVTVGVSFGLHR